MNEIILYLISTLGALTNCIEFLFVMGALGLLGACGLVLRVLR